ncbi:MAG: GNAT family N-acetyltransferase [Vallitaleaceae bacterium]|jgi:GNAT superfamily N-acetyltransferase|nr:GNAT family N-acetyltransferase [Vallitaleaceae bacterium]
MTISTRLNPNELIIKSIPPNEVDAFIDILGHRDTENHVCNTLIAPLVSKEEAHYIAYLYGNPISIGYIHVYFPLQDDILWIQTFIINEAFIRKGFGTAFFNQIIDLFTKRIAINTLYLSCHAANTGGMLFWESLGFKKRTNLTKIAEINNGQTQAIIYEKKCTH